MANSLASSPFESLSWQYTDALLGTWSDNLGLDLAEILTVTQHWLQQFATRSDLGDRISSAFGTSYSADALETLTQDWLTGTFNTLPRLELRSASEINGAYGAFAAATNTIYLSQEFLARSVINPAAVTSVLLEEIGHAVDTQINAVDSPGDEGAIFSALVQGFQLDDPILQPLRTEDDTVVLTLDGQTVQLEQATPGVNPAFDLIGLTQLRNDPRFAGIDGSGFSVAVIDTGLDQTHPLLQPNYLTGRDFINGSSNPIDRQGHGTHVAGTVGARDENIGVAPDVRLIGLQVFQPTPQGPRAFDTTVTAALQ